MIKIIFFWKRYQYEIITSIVDLAVSIASFKILDANIALTITALLISISSIIIIYLKTRDRDFYYLPLDSSGEEKEWVGRGIFRFVRNERCFEITDSHVGYIFPRTSLWDDYQYECNFKIINGCLGFIIRASDLSNYIMLQFTKDGINPHIRLNGQWIRKEHTDPDVNLTFKNELSPDTWYKARIICEKRSIRIVILKGEKPIFDRHWRIPDQMQITQIQVEKDNLGDEKQTSIVYLQNIDFDFGAMGLRDHGDERAFVKDIFVEKL